MEVDEEPPMHSISTVFGYRIIAWRIVNYLPVTCGVEKSIQSPEFCVLKPQLTKWRLYLKPIHDEGLDFIRVSLERLETDPFPENIRFDWKICLSVNGEVVEITTKDKVFRGTRVIRVKMIFPALEKKLTLNESEEFFILCHLIVYDAECDKVFEKSKDADRKSLSQDLLGLFRSGKHHDVKLFSGSTDVICVHKSIVCCRNNVFKNLVKSDMVVDIIFPGMNWEAVKKVISFLYTGDLIYILRVPSFSILRAIDFFKIDELKQYYLPEEMTIGTKINSFEISFTWTVHNLDKIDNVCILGHPVRAFENGEVFQLSLYPKCISGTENYMSIKIRLADRTRFNRLLIQYSVLDNLNKAHNLRCVRHFPSDNEEIILYKIASRSMIEDSAFANKGRLRFFFRFRRFDSDSFEPDIDYKTGPEISIKSEMHYDIFSKQIVSLLETGDYSDYIIGSGNLQFKAHKAILSSRSHVLDRMFHNSDNESSISMPDVEPSILYILLRYIYGGIMERCGLEEILNLYYASKTLFVLTLAKSCFHTAVKNLNTGNAAKILFAAHNHNDLKVKETVFKLVYNNKNDVITQPYWTKIMNEHPSLYTEWTKFLQSQVAHRNK